MAIDNTAPRRIVLITKTATQNQGNQALSIAWRDFLSARYPQDEVRLIERGPAYLKRYTLAELSQRNDPVAAFDALARELVAAMPEHASSDPSRWDVAHEHSQQQVVRFLRLRQVFRLRSRLMALGFGKGDYLERLAYICTANLLVVNPAGEFYPKATDTALHYLLETRCAQLAGVPTAFVNLSFELEDETLVAISNHVFEQCDLFEFRDTESVDYYTEKGGTETPLVLPDGAAMSKIERTNGDGGNGLALAINAIQVHAHGLVGKWDDLVERLLAYGPITLTSNEWSTDYPFWKKYLDMEGVDCSGETFDYAAYANHLAGFDAVVSSRLHTCVLGLIAGAPIIPVETGTFKLSGFFNMIGMADEPIRMEGKGWQDRLQERIESVMADRSGRVALQDQHLAAVRDRSDRMLREAFSDNLPRD